MRPFRISVLVIAWLRPGRDRGPFDPLEQCPTLIEASAPAIVCAGVVDVAVRPESAANGPAGVCNPAPRPSLGPAGVSFPSSEGSAPGGHSGLPAFPFGRSVFVAACPREPTADAAYSFANRTPSVFSARPVSAHLGATYLGPCARGCGRSPLLPRDSGPTASLGWIPSTSALGVAPTAAQPPHLVASCSQGSLPFRRLTA